MKKIANNIASEYAKLIDSYDQDKSLGEYSVESIVRQAKANEPIKQASNLEGKLLSLAKTLRDKGKDWHADLLEEKIILAKQANIKIDTISELSEMIISKDVDVLPSEYDYGKMETQNSQHEKMVKILNKSPGGKMTAKAQVSQLDLAKANATRLLSVFSDKVPSFSIVKGEYYSTPVCITFNGARILWLKATSWFTTTISREIEYNPVYQGLLAHLGGLDFITKIIQSSTATDDFAILSSLKPTIDRVNELFKQRIDLIKSTLLTISQGNVDMQALENLKLINTEHFVWLAKLIITAGIEEYKQVLTQLVAQYESSMDEKGLTLPTAPFNEKLDKLSRARWKEAGLQQSWTATKELFLSKHRVSLSEINNCWNDPGIFTDFNDFSTFVDQELKKLVKTAEGWSRNLKKKIAAPSGGTPEGVAGGTLDEEDARKKEEAKARVGAQPPRAPGGAGAVRARVVPDLFSETPVDPSASIASLLKTSETLFAAKDYYSCIEHLKEAAKKMGESHKGLVSFDSDVAPDQDSIRRYLAKIYMRLGSCYYNLGQLKEALEMYQASINYANRGSDLSDSYRQQVLKFITELTRGAGAASGASGPGATGPGATGAGATGAGATGAGEGSVVDSTSAGLQLLSAFHINLPLFVVQRGLDATLYDQGLLGNIGELYLAQLKPIYSPAYTSGQFGSLQNSNEIFKFHVSKGNLTELYRMNLNALQKLRNLLSAGQTIVPANRVDAEVRAMSIWASAISSAIRVLQQEMKTVEDIPKAPTPNAVAQGKISTMLRSLSDLENQLLSLRGNPNRVRELNIEINDSFTRLETAVFKSKPISDSVIDSVRRRITNLQRLSTNPGVGPRVRDGLKQMLIKYKSLLDEMESQ